MVDAPLPDANEADALEQAQLLDDDLAEGPGPSRLDADDADARDRAQAVGRDLRPTPAPSRLDADEADVLEQQAEVAGEDDERR